MAEGEVGEALPEAEEAEEDVDVDVVFLGSPLEAAMREVGGDAMAALSEEDKEVMAAFRKEEEEAERTAVAKSSSSGRVIPRRASHVSFGVTSLTWPDVDPAVLEVAVAQKILGSELMVSEDEDFIRNFVLTEEAMEKYKRLTEEKEQEGSRTSYLSEALLLTGSLACVAGAVMYFSERTRLAATAAAVLPTALAAAAAVKGSAAASDADKDSEEVKKRGALACVGGGHQQVALKGDHAFTKLVDQLLTDMRLFKQLVRKSLNLLQGMELIATTSGHLSINSATGASSLTASSAAVRQNGSDWDPLTKALKERACFPALRIATYKATVALIRNYRAAVARLLEVSPLADHIDLREHYLSFVDLANFGISEEEVEGSEPPAAELNVKVLKDVVQIALVLQSETLRRLALSFSSRARDEEDAESGGGPMNKAGVLKQVRDLVGTLRRINTKLSKVFEYHQAMGMIEEDPANSSSSSTSALTTTAPPANRADLVPLRTVYTSLFSTGLHLQNSLLKVRQLERAFDAVEQRKTRDTDMVTALLPSEKSLLDWLRGFKDIQGELNACVGCLDDGLAQIDLLKAKEEGGEGEEKEAIVPKVQVPMEPQEEAAPLPVVTGEDEVVHKDEVFEAVTLPEKEKESEEKESEKETPAQARERERREAEKRQSERLLSELRGVLVERSARMKAREDKALKEKRMEASSPNVIIPNLEDLSPEPAEEGLKEVVEQIVEDQTALVQEIRKRDPFLCESLAQSLENGEVDGFGDAFVPREKEESFDDLKTALAMPPSLEEDEERASKREQLANGSLSKSTSSYLGSLSENSSSEEEEQEEEGDSSETDEEDSTSSGQTATDSPDTVKSVGGDSDSESESVASEVRKMPRSVSGHELKHARESESDSESSSSESESHQVVEDLLGKRAKKLRRQQMRTKGLRDSYMRSLSLVPRRKLASEKSNPADSSKPASRCSLSELRSVSSPDIKRLLQQESSSPYHSIENLKKNGKKPTSGLRAGAVSDDEDNSDDDDSSEESCGSADEMQHQVLKTYKRPLRPAATKRSNGSSEAAANGNRKGSVTSMTSITSVSSTSSRRSTKSKRERNRTRSIQSGDLNPSEAVSKKSEESPLRPPPSQGGGSNSYVERKSKEGGGPLFLPSLRPSGFEASLARQAAAKAANGLNGLFRPAMEEVFGGSDDSEKD